MQAPKPLTRNDVIDAYKGLLVATRSKASDIWLGGGSAAIMYGLRETTMDLDAGSTSDTQKRIARMLGKPVRVYNKKDGFLHDDTRILPIEQFYTDLHNEDNVSADAVTTIDGVNCYTIETLLEQKRQLAVVLGRQKDHMDIENILKYIAERDRK